MPNEGTPTALWCGMVVVPVRSELLGSPGCRLTATVAAAHSGGNSRKTAAILLESADDPGTPWILAGRCLFQASRCLLESGDPVGAQRLLHRALRHSSSAEACSGFTPLMRTPEWLVLAAGMLAAGDPTAAIDWWRMAAGSLAARDFLSYGDSEAGIRGDLYAVQAGIQLQLGQSREALDALRMAYQLHHAGGEVVSAASDLLLMSRCELELRRIDDSRESLRLLEVLVADDLRRFCTDRGRCIRAQGRIHDNLLQRMVAHPTETLPPALWN